MNAELTTLIELIEAIESVGTRHPLYFSAPVPANMHFSTVPTIMLCSTPNNEPYSNVVGGWRIPFYLDKISSTVEDITELRDWVLTQRYNFAPMPIETDVTQDAALHASPVTIMGICIAIGHKCAILTYNRQLMSFLGSREPVEVQPAETFPVESEIL
jgi:hypothetical protein